MAYFREQNDDDFRDACAEDDARRDVAEYAADCEREEFELPEDRDSE